jgi:hypothetical protein
MDGFPDGLSDVCTHSRLRKIELKILMNYHQAKSQQVPAIEFGGINDRGVVIQLW